MRRKASFPATGRMAGRGSIMAAVLVVIAIAALVVAAFQDEAASRIRYYGATYRRDDLRAAAYSWFDATLAVINEIRQFDGNQLTSPAYQGYADENAIFHHMGVSAPGDEDIQVSIRVTDEAGRFGLAKIPEPVLMQIFDELGIDLTQAQELADCYYDWVDTDDTPRPNGAEKDEYDKAGYAYVPANKPVLDHQDLLLVKGWADAFIDPETGYPNEAFSRFIGMTSLYNTGKVNRNNATGDVVAVLAVLEQFDGDGLLKHLAGDDGEIGTADDRRIQPGKSVYDPAIAKSTYSALTTQTLRVTVEVHQFESTFTIEAIITTSTSTVTATTSGSSTTVKGNAPYQPRLTGKNSLRYPFTIVRIAENQKL